MAPVFGPVSNNNNNNNNNDAYLEMCTVRRTPFAEKDGWPVAERYLRHHQLRSHRSSVALG